LTHSSLTANFDLDDNRLNRVFTILNTSLILGIFIFSFFFIFNYFVLGKVNIAYLNITSAILMLFLLIDLKRNKAIQRDIYISIFVLFIFFISFIYLNKNDQFGLVWAHFFPAFSIVLLGVSKGTIVSVVYFAIVYSLAYLGIGVWENGQWSTIAFLRLVVSSLVLFTIIIIFETALESSNKKLELLSSTDPLTKLYNRRKINQILEKEIYKVKRYKTTLSLILFDIDNFKIINDTYGHESGDNVLKKLSSSINSQLRNTDSMARWGGEEFLIVTPMIDIQESSKLAEKLRLHIESIQCKNTIKLTCSFGVTEFDIENDSIDSLVRKADLAMYDAKANGKNRISIIK